MSDEKHSKDTSDQEYVEKARNDMKNTEDNNTAQLCNDASAVTTSSTSKCSNDISDRNSTISKIKSNQITGNVSPDSSGTEAMRKSSQESENFQQHMFNIQSAMAAQNAFLTSAAAASGYDATNSMPAAAAAAAAAYYGWLPGIAPVRFPAFFYSPSFIGFPPNMAGLAGSNMPSNTKDQEKSFYYAGDTKQSGRRSVEGTQPAGNNNKNTSLYNDSKSGDVETADSVDEGLELEENDSQENGKRMKRIRQWEDGKSFEEPRRMVSVIQKNCSVSRKSSYSDQDNSSAAVSEDGSDDLNEDERETKRGRASTRQIEKTQQYWDRRRKNNVSAKKSRDARRQREMLTNQRSAMLEAETLRLRAEVAALREENERLKKQFSNVATVAVSES